jgi:hypothetical protein
MSRIGPTSSVFASGHRRDDADFVASREGRVDTLAVTDVLAVDEHIYVPAKLPRVIAKSLPNPWVGSLKSVKDLRHTRTAYDDLGFSGRESAQRCWNEHGNARLVLHDVTPTQTNVSRDPRVRWSDSAIRRRSR